MKERYLIELILDACNSAIVYQHMVDNETIVENVELYVHWSMIQYNTVHTFVTCTMSLRMGGGDACRLF